uniref:hypothetical protein n=1 Tax=Serratia quinivorans TaxID=137545 RepID=UPI0035C786BA
EAIRKDGLFAVCERQKQTQLRCALKQTPHHNILRIKANWLSLIYKYQQCLKMINNFKYI